MRELPVTGGGVALVDDDAPPWIFRYTWRLNPQGYVFTTRLRKRHFLHRAVMGATPGTELDHIHHDLLDNRRESLRFVTRSENSQNRKGANAGSRTGVRNVRPHKGGFQVKLYAKGRHICLGTFPTIEEAARVAEEARAVHMGGPSAPAPRSAAVLTKRGQCETCGEYERLRLYQDGRYVCKDCRRRFDKYGPPPERP